MNLKDKVDQFNETTKDFTAEKILRFAHEKFKNEITFASSLGEEDQVLTDMIAKCASDITIFTLDTGRLFPESHKLIEETQKKYQIDFKIYYPDTEALEDMVDNHGINLFYDSVENRKLCCGIRKVQPLKRALKEKQAWITGLRKAQSVTRASAKAFEWDSENEMIKINPLVDWTLDQVKEYIKDNNVPVNSLHEKGFVSIGCAPCTRAIKSGEDIRAGRWWWELPESKECGLHNNPNRPKKDAL